MKAKPMLLVPGAGYVECEAHEATHLTRLLDDLVTEAIESDAVVGV